MGDECSMDDDGDYVLAVQGTLGDHDVEICIDAANPGHSNWTRYINGIKERHDIQNVTFFLAGTYRSPFVGIKTVRPIAKGDELLLNYGPEYWT
jgi:hypothetical protein